MELLDIHDQYYERLKRFILSIVRNEWAAEDLVQDTFIKINKNSASLKNKSKLSSWIFRIAYNVCMDYLNSRPVKNEQPMNELIPFFAERMALQKQFEQYQMGACVQEKMSMLPDSLKLPLILFDVEGFTHQEIAEILNISMKAAKVRLHRARKELKKILEKECSFEKDERDVLVCNPREKNSDGK